VSNRTGLAPGKNPLIVEQELNATTPREYRKDAHHWLLLHGRYVCVARTPLCPKCIIADLCEYPNKTPPKEESKPARKVGPLADRAEAKAAAVRKVASTVRARASRAGRALLLKPRAGR
jgi:adenine-specific DNA glycosylase